MILLARMVCRKNQSSVTVFRLKGTSRGTYLVTASPSRFAASFFRLRCFHAGLTKYSVKVAVHKYVMRKGLLRTRNEISVGFEKCRVRSQGQEDLLVGHGGEHRLSDRRR